MNNCPCKDCDRRTVTCHGVCKAYKEWQVLNDAINHKKGERS